MSKVKSTNLKNLIYKKIKSMQSMSLFVAESVNCLVVDKYSNCAHSWLRAHPISTKISSPVPRYKGPYLVKSLFPGQPGDQLAADTEVKVWELLGKP